VWVTFDQTGRCKSEKVVAEIGRENRRQGWWVIFEIIRQGERRGGVKMWRR
jgi:hypothetical protein